MKSFNFLAFDIGATSGRAVVASFTGSKFEITEILRFPNAMTKFHGKLYWNIYSLYDSLVEAISICAKKQIDITSIAIDTWGVDFGYIAKDGTILALPRAYRDPYTDGVPERYFEIIPREKVYDATGIQIMNFNSLFQPFAAKEEDFAPLDKADKILFIPDLLSYMLTGKMNCEYTNATTSQMVNPKERKFETPLLTGVGINPSILLDISFPPKHIGTLTEEVMAKTGAPAINVISVASHDTASAVVAVPAVDQHFAYLSSGTWSLMGIESPNPIISKESFENNFTNEGGVDGTTRFLKNITGMWILEECRKHWTKQGKDYSYEQIVEMAQSAVPFAFFINPDDPSFANPKDMLAVIKSYCKSTGQGEPLEDKQVIRLIFESLACRYREVLMLLEKMSPYKIDTLHVIGGGSKNNLLNTFTANAIGKPVVAGPAEATAIGNVMMQAKAAGIVSSLKEIRAMILSNIETQTFTPQDVALWERAYNKYCKITKK